MKHSIICRISALVLVLTAALCVSASATSICGLNSDDQFKVDHSFLKSKIENCNTSFIVYGNESSSLLKMPKANDNTAHVQCVIEYNDNVLRPASFVTVSGCHHDFCLYDNQEYAGEIPLGEYDFVIEFNSLDQSSVMVCVKESVNIQNDTILTFNAADCTNEVMFTALNPQGEEFVVYDGGIHIEGSFDGCMNSYSLIRKSDSKRVGFVAFGTPRIFINNISNRLMYAENRIYYNLLPQTEFYVVQMYTNDINLPQQNDISNYFYHEEHFEHSPACRNSPDGFGVGIKVLTCYNSIVSLFSRFSSFYPDDIVRMHICPPTYDPDNQDRVDFFVRPFIYDETRDNKAYQIAGMPVAYDNGTIHYVNIGSDDCISMYQGNSFQILKNDSNLHVLTNENRAFSFSADQKALSYGSNTPINVFTKVTEWSDDAQAFKHPMYCNYVGRYGETRVIDLAVLDTKVTINGNEANCNLQSLGDFLAPYNNDREKGEIELTFDNKNVIVDGMQGENLSTIHYNELQDDTSSPTLTMLWFKNKNNEQVIDRFATGNEGILEFSCGDLNYICDEDITPISFTLNGYYEFAGQSVEVSYSPYKKEQWDNLLVEEVPENFQMPGWGAFYRGSLAGVSGQALKGWFDLKVKLTDSAGNWQEQVISPAFRIDDLAYSSIETMGSDNPREIARYNLAGQPVDANYIGVVIIKMSDGTAQKVVVK